MKRINFKQPKYILPAVILIPVIFVGLMIISIFSTSIQSENKIVIEGEINTDMPTPNMEAENMKMRSKYQTMLNDFGKISDYAAVQNLNEENNSDESNTQYKESLYSDEEIRMLDSLEQEKNEQIKQLEKLREQTQNNIKDQDENENKKEDNELTKQLELLQKIANGGDEKVKKNEENISNQAENIQQEKEDKIKPSIVHYVKKINNNFNTINKKKENSNVIKAILDEEIKAEIGSRLKIRLLDNIEIDGNTLKKGSYLYAIVSGFSAQRIKGEVSSILIDNQLIKISLSIYDNDGIEGLFVPASAFRDFQKEASSQALSSNNINIGESGGQDFKSMAFQTLQNVYQNTTQAISKNITKNKAKLKYNTEVYLINKSK